MHNTEKMRQLRTAVELLYQHAGIAENKIICAKFDRTLFSDDFQSLAFYQREIQCVLSQLEQLPAEQTEECRFLAEKLLSQCTALSEALNRSSVRPAAQSAVSFKPNLSKSVQAKYEVHKLPPRERLVKYYEALEALNDKISRQEIALQNVSASEKTNCEKQLEITQQRKKRCLEAIELLEEYLAFSAEEKM